MYPSKCCFNFNYFISNGEKDVPSITYFENNLSNSFRFYNETKTKKIKRKIRIAQSFFDKIRILRVLP